MHLQPKKVLSDELGISIKQSKDYVYLLSDTGCKSENKLPSNSNNYSELLEDTDWKSHDINFICSKHYRRDLDALS